jgi:transposase
MASKGKTKPKKDSRQQKQVIAGLQAIQQHAAGIDIGSTEHWACAPLPDGSGREIASFGASTPELIRMREWLQGNGVETVAMDSTGVYWIAPYEVLEAAGMEVRLVDTRQLSNVPGRDKKSDPGDCQWIQRLHSCGLLRGAFRPTEEVSMLRTLIRDKATLVGEASDWLRRMQKALEQMNVRVHRAVSDLDGQTGMAMVRAILEREQDPKKLAELRDPRCHKTEKRWWSS